MKTFEWSQTTEHCHDCLTKSTRVSANCHSDWSATILSGGFCVISTGKEKKEAKCRRKDRRSVAKIPVQSQKNSANIFKIFWCRGARWDNPKSGGTPDLFKESQRTLQPVLSFPITSNMAGRGRMMCQRQVDMPEIVLLILGSPSSYRDVFPHAPTTLLPACLTCPGEKETKTVTHRKHCYGYPRQGFCRGCDWNSKGLQVLRHRKLLWARYSSTPCAWPRKPITLYCRRRHWLAPGLNTQGSG